MPADIDAFAASLLEESKRFLEKASEYSDGPGREAHLHASLMLAFCSLDAHINAVAEEMVVRPDLTPHDRGVLLEKEVRLESGQFQVLGRLHMYPSDERIAFLHFKFAGKPIDRTSSWWSQLSEAIVLRNRLTHPKGATQIALNDVKRALEAIIGAIDALYSGIYKTRFPAVNRGLQSRLEF
jgi:hypothetical protein